MEFWFYKTVFLNPYEIMGENEFQPDEWQPDTKAADDRDTVREHEKTYSVNL